MCYHQARSARFIGHCWGRGWRDASENLLQTSIINRLGSFPLRRICGTQRSTTFIPLCESFQVGDSVAWGRGRGGEKTQTNKQNTDSKLQQHSNDDSRESWQALFFFVLEKSHLKKGARPWSLMNKPTLLYKRSPREAFIRETRCATVIPSIINK